MSKQRKKRNEFQRNCKSYNGREISILVEGKLQAGNLSHPINVVVNGNVDVLDHGSGNVTAQSVGKLRSGSGDVTCGNVSGDIRTGSGDVTCGNVRGSIKTGSGNVS